MKKGMKSLFCILPTVLLVVFAFSLVLFAGENADGSALKGSFVDPILPPDPFFTTTQPEPPTTPSNPTTTEPFTPTTTETEQPPTEPEPPLPQLAKGDVNGDGKVDIADAMLVFYHVAQKERLTAAALDVADIDGNDDVDIADAMTVFYSVAFGGEDDHCHIFEDTRIPATCTETGTLTRKCIVCEKAHVRVLAVIPHSYRTEKLEPTCETDGYIRKICENCGKTEETVLPATGHNIKTEEKAPTCEADGYIRKICETCRKTEETVLPATGHNIKTEEKAPTCEADGYIRKICENCGKTEETVLPATGHSIKTEEKAPTCEEDGYNREYCEKCGFEKRKTLKAHHKWERGQIISEPTEKGEGRAEFACSVCGKKKTDDVPRLRGKAGIFKYYSQWEDRWCNARFGNYTMGRNGCAPTSVAMALSYIGINVTPIEVATWLYDNTEEFCKTFSGSSGSAIRLAAEHYGATTLNIFEYEDLLSALENDGVVCIAVGEGLLCNKGTHCVFLYGYDAESGNVKVADPWTSARNGSYDLAEIWAERSTSPVDMREDGCVAYGIR